MNSSIKVVLRRSAPFWLCAALASCAMMRSPASLAPGTTIAEARQTFGAGDEYALPDGGTRLAFRRGRDTYMLDFDANGRLLRSSQVLTPPSFATIQPGMSKTDVLTRLGQPAFVFPVGYQQLQVWNYRFGGLEGDCMVFQISFSNATGAVTEAGQGPDPACSRDSAHD
jgi:hypothetical protein